MQGGVKNTSWSIGTDPAKGTLQGTRDVVVDDGSSSTGGFGKGSLFAECTRSSGNQGDVSGDGCGIIRRGAAEVVDLDEGSARLARGSIRHVDGLVFCAIGAEFDGGGREQLDEGLLIDIVVVGCLQRLVDVVDGRIVAWAD